MQHILLKHRPIDVSAFRFSTSHGKHPPLHSAWHFLGPRIQGLGFRSSSITRRGSRERCVTAVRDCCRRWGEGGGCSGARSKTAGRSKRCAPEPALLARPAPCTLNPEAYVLDPAPYPLHLTHKPPSPAAPLDIYIYIYIYTIYILYIQHSCACGARYPKPCNHNPKLYACVTLLLCVCE